MRRQWLLRKMQRLSAPGAGAGAEGAAAMGAADVAVVADTQTGVAAAEVSAARVPARATVVMTTSLRPGSQRHERVEPPGSINCRVVFTQTAGRMCMCVCKGARGGTGPVTFLGIRRSAVVVAAGLAAVVWTDRYL